MYIRLSSVKQEAVLEVVVDRLLQYAVQNTEHSMSKKDKNQYEDGFNAGIEMEETAAAVDVDAAQAKKEAKAEAARRFKEKRAAEKADRIVKSKDLIAYMQEKGYWDDLTDDLKGFLNGMANPTAVSSSGNSSLFKTLFGDNPQVGDAITLQEVFNKTLKGKSNIDFYVKRWAEKGIVIRYEADAANLLNSKYVIESLN